MRVACAVLVSWALLGCTRSGLHAGSPDGADGLPAAPSDAVGAGGSAADATAGQAGGNGFDASVTADADVDAAGDGASVPDGASDGALFDSDAGPLPPARYRALAVAAGRYHACALLDDHRVKCWGNNGYGQLGVGDANARVVPNDMGDNLPVVDLGTGRTAKAITAGRYATCALLDDDSVKCWGWAPLALGADRNPAANLPGTSSLGLIGNEPGEMGDALARRDLGAGRTARLVALGYYEGCVVKDDESTQCWSSNTATVDATAARGKKIAQLVGAGGVLALFDDGTARQLAGAGSLPSREADAGIAGPIVALAGSRTRSCALWANGESLCNGTQTPWWPPALAREVVVPAIIELSAYSCGILKDGHVACPTARNAPWNNDVGDARGPFVRLGQPAVSLTSGSIGFFCAALQNGEVKCWDTAGDMMGMQGGTVASATSWPSVDLGTRTAR